MSSKKSSKRAALGMGLDALIPEKLEGDFFLCPIEDVHPSSSQPRREFSDETIAELAQSISEKGLIQPIVVRVKSDGGYELIAGERRWRAAQKAGLMEVPAIIRAAAEDEVLELALIENLQREDLNPVDEAHAYRALLDRTGWSQEELAERIGKSRATVANSTRLLGLPGEALEALRAGLITPGHARAVLAVQTEQRRLEFLREIVAKGYSVRQAEAKTSTFGRDRKRVVKKKKTADVVALEERLSRVLGTKVLLEVGSKPDSGRIAIPYSGLDELDRILDALEQRR